MVPYRPLSLSFVAFVGMFLLSVLPAKAAEDISLTVNISVCGNEVAEDGEQCDNDDLRDRACTDFGFDDGALTCASSCTVVTTQCTTVADNKTEKELPSIGGSANVAHQNRDLSLTVPSAAIERAVSVKLFAHSREHFQPTRPAPANKSFVGNTYDVVLVDVNGVTLEDLNASATIVLVYLEEDIGSLDEETFAAYHYKNDSWQEVTSAVLDIAANTLSFSSDSFSPFAIMGELPAAASSDVESSGRSGSSRSWTCATSDISCDGVVDLVDFSIVVYWYGRVSPPSSVDVNGDGIVNLVDLSILTFHWS